MSAPEPAFRYPDRPEHQRNGVPGCTVSHVAGWNRCHPGETVTFYTRVETCREGVTPSASGLTLEISLPKELILVNYCALGPERPASSPVSSAERTMPQITTGQDGAHHLIWTIGQDLAPSACFECQVEAQVIPMQHDLVLESHAVAASGTGDEWFVLSQETATVTISTVSEYLRYLPAIYQEDDLMGRFLMLFGSFWKPLERQINDLWLYFDPQLTPAEFLPWLASWMSLMLDESWPEEKRRQLIRSALSLYRKRGTRQGLEEYLAIYTGVKPRIVEHRAYDFRLGPESQLGPGIALGKGNMPHTFTITLRLPAVSSQGDDQKELARQRRQKIEAIIDAEKPAHTTYTLHIETV